MSRLAMMGLAATVVGAADALKNGTCNITGDCTIDEAGCMMSPKYPKPYPVSTAAAETSLCTASCDGVFALEVVAFETDVKDKLMFDGAGRAYFGEKTPAVVLDPKGGELVFNVIKGTFLDKRAGFKICPENPDAKNMWSVTAPCGFCADKCITSPGFPQLYGESGCRITYPANMGKVIVKHFELAEGDSLGNLTGGVGPFIMPLFYDIALFGWYPDLHKSNGKKGWKLCPKKVAPKVEKKAECPVASDSPAKDAVDEFSMESGSLFASNSLALTLTAAVAAVAGAATGWLAFRRRVTSGVADADHRALTQADGIEAGAE